MSEVKITGHASAVPTVLAVDDDIECLAEMCELIDSLGFSVKGVDSVKSALLTIAEDEAIGILITDLRMQVMDGFDLLAEIDARFARTRRIVKMVASGFPSYEHATDAMRSGAVDFIDKPITAEKLKLSFRRAMGHWQAWPDVDDQAAALVRAPVPNGTVPENGSLARMVKRLQRERMLRTDTLQSKLFSDPAWDILLDLMAADLDGQQVSVSSACAAAQVPFSTGLRYVNRLVRANLAVRFDDPNDKRRDLLRISDLGRQAMGDYVGKLAAKDRDLAGAL